MVVRMMLLRPSPQAVGERREARPGPGDPSTGLTGQPARDPTFYSCHTPYQTKAPGALDEKACKSAW